MATYSARPLNPERAQRAWDVLASRYPNMRPAQLVSEVQGILGWQWSMRFEAPDGGTVFWDRVPVPDIRKLVDGSRRAKQPVVSRKLRIVHPS